MSRPQRQTVTLLKIEDKDIVRHEVLAYHDGYADARDYGQDGFWMPESYNRAAKEQYLKGFQKGLRVHRVMLNL